MRLPTAAVVVLLLLTLPVLAACGGEATPPGPPAHGAAPLAPAPAADDDRTARTRVRAVSLAQAAVEALGDDPTLGLLLAREALRVAATPEVHEALHRALRAVRGDAPFAAHRGSTLDVAWSPDGTLVLTTSLDFDARLWNVEGEEVALLRGHGGKVLGGAFSPDGEHVLTWSVDHTARLWNREGALLHTLAGHTAELITAEFTPDGKHVLTVSLDGTARLWSLGGEHERTIEGPDDADRVRSAHATAGEDAVQVVTVGGAHLTDTALPDGDVILEVWDDEEGAAERIVVSPDGARWVVLTDAAETPLYDGQRRRMLAGHAAQALGAAFSADEQRIATGSLDSTARLWDADGQETAVLEGHGGAVFSVAFSPDAGRVLTVSWDRTARLWDLEGQELAVFGSQELPLVSADFSPRGDVILTRSYQAGPARLWDLEGRLLQALPDDSGRTIAASFSPAGAHVLTLDRHLTPHVFTVGGVEQAVDAWLATQRELTAAERRRYQELLRGDGALAPEALDFAAARPAPDTGPARGDAAGTVACAACHREAYEQWVRSSHARTSFFATEEVLPPAVLAEQTVEHPPGKTSFRREGDRWIARTVGDDGEEQDFDLTMVSGHLRVRFFMTRMPDGRLQVLPAMYELPTGAWFDYTKLLFGAGGDFDTPPVVEPGAPSFWTGPVRSWDARCAHCHMSGKSAVDPGPDGVGPRILARAYAVDCEACHGPARLHAEAWERLEMDETLERLETWSREQKVALCTQCHQEGEVLDPPYVPGTDLYEYIDPTVVIDPERADPAGRPLELIYDGTPFATSHCANAGGLTCSTCHAPHGSEVRSLLRQPHEDGALCVDCHKEIVEDAAGHSHHQPTGTGAQCVPCHMPFLTIERGHGAVADHTIGIPRMGLVSDRVQTDACTWCHSNGLGAPSDAPVLAEEELWRAYEAWWPDRDWPRPWMAALANARLGDADAGPALVAAIRDLKNPREARASAARLLGRYASAMADAIFEATRDFDSLVRRNAVRALSGVEGQEADARLLEALSDPSWAVRVAAARTALDGWSRVQANRELLEAVIPVLDRDAKKVPDDDLRWFRLGAAYDLLGDKTKALEAYERKARLDPYATSVHRHVKDLRALLGLDD